MRFGFTAPAGVSSSSSSSRSVRRRSRLNRAIADTLDTRTLLTGFNVNATTDAGAGTGNSGDLRYCLAQANSTAGADTITFDPTVFASAQTINLASELTITDTSGAGAGGTTITGP